MTAGVWTEASVDVDGVTIRYRTRGEGRPVVFVHGVHVGGSLRDDVAARLDGVRSIVPTWPLGAHRDPAPCSVARPRTRAVDLSPLAVGASRQDVARPTEERDERGSCR